MVHKSKIQTELDLLSALEQDQVTTQMTLSKRVSVSVGLINALLKRALKKGLVKVRAAPYKRYAYYLTPQGFVEKSRLVAEYLDSSLDFFRLARSEYAVLFNSAFARGKKRFLLIGSGELVEIALMSAHGLDIEFVGIFALADESLSPAVPTLENNVHGLTRFESPKEFPGVDSFVIVASRHPQFAYDQITSFAKDHNIEILAPSFLRINRNPSNIEKSFPDDNSPSDPLLSICDERA